MSYIIIENTENIFRKHVSKDKYHSSLISKFLAFFEILD